MKTIWQTIGGLMLSAALLLPAARADTGYGDSPVFSIDLRGLLTANLTGRVVANATPVANAQVRLEGTAYDANTVGDGTFTLTSVPVGNGYVVDVSATDYYSKRLTGVNVAAGANNLGNISLTTGGGPYRLTPMVPDVNPTTTTVEAGGTAYRYYRVLNSSGSPAGGVAVSVQIAGGPVIAQTSDVSSYWPGQTAGLSDADGVVRISIPASSLGASGTVQTVQLSASGQVQQTFQAQVVPRQYDQVWTQKLSYGGSGGTGVINVGANVSPESTICHTIVGGTTTAESISRVNTTGIQVGPSAGVDVGLSLKTTSLSFSGGGGASAGAQLSGAVVARSTYTFADPNSTDPGQNAIKLYLDLGNILASTPGPQMAFYAYAQKTIEPLFLGSSLSSVEGEVQVGAGAQGQVGFAVTGGSHFQVGVGGNGSVDGEAIGGFEKTFGASTESAVITGVSASGSATVNLGSSVFDIGNAIGLGDVEMLAKLWTKEGQGRPYRTEKIQKLSLDVGEPMTVPAWQQYDPQALYSSYQRDFKETQDQSSGNPLVTYEWSVCAAQQNFGLNLNLDVVAFGVNLHGELDQGAQAVNQRGAILQSRYWPTEAYPAITATLFPNQSWVSILSQWGYNATGPIGQAVHEGVTAVETAGNTVIQAGQATLNVVEGGLSSGVQVVSSWASSVMSDLNIPNPLGRIHPLDGGSGTTWTYLPPDGASNYVYGIGGIYRFESTNSLNGTATLSISYSNADVVGLDPETLQIYQLPDGTNRWRLIGGTVDTVSNTVTATITNLGTYAVASPLPAGDLQLIPSTSALPADGVSQMTVVVSNLVLNTGNVATQQWLFTATAIGAQILNPDCDTNLPGIQVISTNGTVTLSLKAPPGGTVAQISLESVAGDAFGSVAINLVDTNPPATPTNIVVTAGQSRIWVTWATNSEPDVAGYRVYYRTGQNGPPYDGTAAVEGNPSPMQITGTNCCLLRGLALGTNYFVTVSAVDSAGNESPLGTPIQVTTAQAPPAAPTGVAARFDSDGTNFLMWALSEDDGYNDRDVIRYDILRAVLPDGSYEKVGEVAAGIGIYTESNLTVAPTQYVGYAVIAVASNGLTSAQALANRFMPDRVIIDNDGDGIPDWWMTQYFGHPTGLASDQSLAQDDPARDGLSNLQKYLLGRNPLIWDNLHFVGCDPLPDGQFKLNIFGQVGQNYTVLGSTDLVNWTPVLSFTCTNAPMSVVDPGATYSGWRFYRVAQ